MIALRADPDTALQLRFSSVEESQTIDFGDD